MLWVSGRRVPWSHPTEAPSAPGNVPNMWSKDRFSCIRITTCLIGVFVCRFVASKTGTSGCTVATFVSLGEGEVVVCAAESAVHATSTNSNETRNARMFGGR